MSVNLMLLRSSCLLIVIGILSGCITHKHRSDPNLFADRIHPIHNLVVNGDVEFVNTAKQGDVEFYTVMGKSFQMDYHQVTDSAIEITKRYLVKTEHKNKGQSKKQITVQAYNGMLRQIAGGWNHTIDITIEFETSTGIIKKYTKSGTEWGVTNDAKLTEATMKIIEEFLHDEEINAYLSK